MTVQPNQVYVIPPNKFLSIKDSVLHLSEVPATRRSETAIDTFLISLAKDQQEYAIGVVLSGTGTSGSQGLKEIKLAGGMVMAQLPSTAEFDQMPQSAVGTGLMDYSESEAVQMTIFDIVPEQHQGQIRTMLDQIKSGLRVDSFESRRSTKDGRILDVWLTVTAVMDYGKRPALANSSCMWRTIHWSYF